MEENDIHFETEDFKGRKIVCTKTQWYDHITESAHHSYMEGAEEDVIDALKNPHNGYRCYDLGYKNRRIYYRYNKTWDDFLKVVVQYEDNDCNGTGYILTAYQKSGITEGERPEL